jgi:hypothetical protein
MKLTEGYKKRLEELAGIQSDFAEKLKYHLITGKYLYHYTLTDNLESIKEEGLVPRKNPNSHYATGSQAIFLTKSSSLYNANLPQSLMDVMDAYYDSKGNKDEEQKPIIRLTIDVSKLDLNKLIWDDDYILNRYKWNKAKTKPDKIIESLDIWGSIAYLDIIPPNLIVKTDFNYSA